MTRILRWCENVFFCHIRSRWKVTSTHISVSFWPVPGFFFCYDSCRDSQSSQFVFVPPLYLCWVSLWFSHSVIYFSLPIPLVSLLLDSVYRLFWWVEVPTKIVLFLFYLWLTLSFLSGFISPPHHFMIYIYITSWGVFVGPLWMWCVCRIERLWMSSCGECVIVMNEWVRIVVN